jgi:hypothetical protein
VGSGVGLGVGLGRGLGTSGPTTAEPVKHRPRLSPLSLLPLPAALQVQRPASSGPAAVLLLLQLLLLPTRPLVRPAATALPLPQLLC